MELYLVKTLSGTLKVAYDSDYENIKNLPLNEPFKVEYKKQRNAKFHRKFFSLVKLVYDNQEVYNNIDHLRKHLTIASGFYELVIDLETEFSELYNRFIDTVHKYFGIDKQDLIDNINQYY